MADDIDELLDEIESKYINEETRRKHTIPLIKTRSDLLGCSDDLTAVIEDICHLPEPLELNISRSPSNEALDKRCFITYLAGSNTPMGMSNSINCRACSNLHCTTCDFRIVSFDNFEWDSSTDYLFLRNNMPDFERLKFNLKVQTGARAYACQCQWRTIFKLTDIKSDSDLKWICARH